MSLKKFNKKHSLYLFLLVLVLLALFLYFKINDIQKNNLITKQENKLDVIKYAFLQDIKYNIKTDASKHNAFLFINRYIDNGGNIYEIYDYIYANPELAFLKEAEKIYPKAFSSINERGIPHTYSDKGLYAYLAYLEILDKYGYGNSAIYGSLTFYYIKMAYYQRMILQDHSRGASLAYPSYSEEEINSNIRKASTFQKQADLHFKSISQITNNDVMGLIQYASSLRYFESLKLDLESYKTSDEIFSNLITYTYNHQSNEMYLYTALSNAATYLLVNFQKDNLRNALYPFFDIKDGNNGGLTQKILNSRFNKNVSRFRDLDIYSRKNILYLSRNVPEFKNWLILNGWKEADFN